jgi:hypothetical protein
MVMRFGLLALTLFVCTPAESETGNGLLQASWDRDKSRVGALAFHCPQLQTNLALHPYSPNTCEHQFSVATRCHWRLLCIPIRPTIVLSGYLTEVPDQ